MIISRDIAASLQSINQQGNDKTNAPSSAGIGDNDFHSILKGLLQNTQNTHPDPSNIKALNKEQLMLFSKALQIQMNSRLYNTVFNNSLETNYLAQKITQGYGNNLAQLVPNASKSSQQTSKMALPEGDASLNKIVNEAAQKYDVDPNLIRAVIKAESNNNPAATSPKGAMGLMQLMPETARELGVKNAYDAQENVMGGTRYLKMLLSRYDGQVDLALAAYNWGMGNLEKKPNQLPEETISYVEKVNSYYQTNKA